MLNGHIWLSLATCAFSTGLRHSATFHTSVAGGFPRSQKLRKPNISPFFLSSPVQVSTVVTFTFPAFLGGKADPAVPCSRSPGEFCFCHIEGVFPFLLQESFKRRYNLLLHPCGLLYRPQCVQSAAYQYKSSMFLIIFLTSSLMHFFLKGTVSPD